MCISEIESFSIFANMNEYIQILPTESEQQLINDNINADVHQLAFKIKNQIDIRNDFVLRQIEGRQLLRKKVPTWTNINGVVFPRHLSIEQCSSELSASYKASIVKGKNLVDLTGGFGVDFFFMSRQFESSVYVEQQQELVEIAKHNMPLLGLSNSTYVCDDSVNYLQKQIIHTDCIYIDPARRNSFGAKTVHLSDCSPDLSQLESLLVKKADIVVAKLSPMLDISEVLSILKNVIDIHIVAINNECKELLLILSKIPKPLSVYAINIQNDSNIEKFIFSLDDERNCECKLANNIGKYLYEPNVAIMKAGAFKTICSKFDVYKLHQHSHLYTSNNLVNNFPGRIFEIVSYGGFSKKDFPESIKNIKSANITVRNFPIKSDELRRKLKLSDGGNDYIFATTICNDKHIILHCKKVKS